MRHRYLPRQVEVRVNGVQHLVSEMQVLAQELVVALSHQVSRALAQDDDMTQVGEEIFAIVKTGGDTNRAVESDQHRWMAAGTDAIMYLCNES